MYVHRGHETRSSKFCSEAATSKSFWIKILAWGNSILLDADSVQTMHYTVILFYSTLYYTRNLYSLYYITVY